MPNYQRDADLELEEASDWSKIPFFGESMASGNFAKARQDLGKRGEEIINDVDMPEFAQGDYGGYELAGQYDPTAADYSTIDEDPALRELEMQALGKLSGSMDASSQTKAAAAKYAALDEANKMASAREGAIRQQGERSGQGGNGMNALMEAQAAQMGANRAKSGTLDATHQLALEKLANEQAMMGAAGNVRGEDFKAKSANADIINKFGMFNTQMANDAQLRNLQATQGVNNANVDMKNKSLDRGDRNAQTMFGNKMNKATARGNAVQGMSNAVGQSQQSAAGANARETDTAKDLLSAAGMFFGGGA